MKPKTPNQKKAYDALNARLAKYMAQVQGIYDDICLRLANAVSLTDYDGVVEFLFKNYPELASLIGQLMADYAAQMNSLIYSGTSEEWKQSNLLQDLLVEKAMKVYGFDKGGDKYNRYFQIGNAALKAFQQRKDRGLNLSQKLWRQSEELKKELECALSVAIERGTSAITLSKRLSQYLVDFPKMKADYTEKFGHAASCRDCEYASMRLARSEINMAYRTAEHLRWQQFDFILGFDVKLSGRHPAPDICDDLKGRYPKDFKFTGWHPNCMCYTVPVVMTDDEYMADDATKKVKDVPDAFKRWILNNQDRIAEAERRGTLPYFLKDNKELYKGISIKRSVKEIMQKAKESGAEVQSFAHKAALAANGIVTPVNYKSEASITRKVNTEMISPYDIKDAVRTTVIVPEQGVEKALAALSGSPSFVRLKRQRPESFMGYSGNIVNIRTSNGLIAEIQVNTAKMIYAKETPGNAKRILGEKRWNEIFKQTGIEGGLGHKYYEQWRLLDKGSEKARKIAEKSEEYYRHFQ